MGPATGAAGVAQDTRAATSFFYWNTVLVSFFGLELLLRVITYPMWYLTAEIWIDFLSLLPIIARVWLDANMTLPGLAMARSIGDHLVSSVGVIAEPVVQWYSFTLPPDESSDGPYFLVMASDGVWEFIESVSACALVKKFLLQEGQNPDSTVRARKQHSHKQRPPLSRTPLAHTRMPLARAVLSSLR